MQGARRTADHRRDPDGYGAYRQIIQFRALRHRTGYFHAGEGARKRLPGRRDAGEGRAGLAFTAGSHGSTFGGTPIATAVVKATIETLQTENAAERAAETGEYLVSELRDKLAGNPFVKTVRGKGLLVGIVCNGPVRTSSRKAQKRGLLVITAGPDVVRLLPSLLVTREEVDQAVSILAAMAADAVANQTAAAQLS